MAKTAVVTESNVLVREQLANNPDGSPAVNQWSGNPEQLEKHLDTFAAHSQKLPAGDVSAIRDAARDAKAARIAEAKNR